MIFLSIIDRSNEITNKIIFLDKLVKMKLNDQ